MNAKIMNKKNVLSSFAYWWVLLCHQNVRRHKVLFLPLGGTIIVPFLSVLSGTLFISAVPKSYVTNGKHISALIFCCNLTHTIWSLYYSSSYSAFKTHKHKAFRNEQNFPLQWKENHATLKNFLQELHEKVYSSQTVLRLNSDNTNLTLMSLSKGMRLFQRHSCWQKNNIKMGLRERCMSWSTEFKCVSKVSSDDGVLWTL